MVIVVGTRAPRLTPGASPSCLRPRQLNIHTLPEPRSIREMLNYAHSDRKINGYVQPPQNQPLAFPSRQIIWAAAAREVRMGRTISMTIETSDKKTALQPGTLYLVATPIGNLEDITLRALRVLRECDLVAAEDTRRTGLLLRHFGISKPLLSYFKFNEARRSEAILERLGRSETIALVTDAGSPGISDPGERVAKAVLAAGFRVEPVPGPCALIAALTASGLSTDEFHFVGFLPHKTGQRRHVLERLKDYAGTLAFYESPFRLEKLLLELVELFPERTVVVARELTKRFEEFLRGKPSELLTLSQNRSWKGELVVLVSGL
jgi:16S rRNA (cytidine1402-2'-O)-methyltransferase